MAPEVENIDLYVVDIDREVVRPGAVYYDPDGHVLMVYRVEDDGTVRFLDGHPDNSLTVTRFGSQLARGSAAQGGGFHQWRTVRFDGDFSVAANADCPRFSATAQYQSSYSVGGMQLDYFAWVRATLGSGAALNPVTELGDQLGAICDALQARVAAVADGADMARRPHPGVLPPDIFSADGDWEAFSTPARDVSLKVQVRNARALIASAAASVGSGDGRFAYSGTRAQLVADLSGVWRDRSSSCGIAYKGSTGVTVRLTLAQVVARLFALSFDPYHCPELRWGARSGAEAATCPSDSLKQSMYDREQGLRNLIDREGITSTPLDSGPATSPDLDIAQLLLTL
jgi:hypothetical protein